jgi:uncharacterized metal-binding protein
MKYRVPNRINYDFLLYWDFKLQLQENYLDIEVFLSNYNMKRGCSIIVGLIDLSPTLDQESSHFKRWEHADLNIKGTKITK